MALFKNKFDTLFFGFLISIILVFLFFRPLNSPWHKFIAGDGFGYYAYLPATYIYKDTDYSFKWFNKIYKANYVYESFPNPEDNFLVAYNNKRINKYYQGLSYIWLPFFGAAHLVAKFFNYPADGFSQPYQLFIGFASIFYLIIGLVYLRKIIYKLFQNNLASTLTPIAIFYGTYLYYYSINLNSQSHTYSFVFFTLFIYHLLCFFEAETKLRPLIFTALFFVIAVCIRPLNGLIILTVPAFMPTSFFKQPFRLGKIKWVDGFLISILIGALINQFMIMYIQTHSLFPYTYSNERFYFNQSKFLDALFSYNIGLFTYVPLAFISLFGIRYLSIQKKIILPFVLFVVIFLYSSWWYWPITSRGIIDFYPILAICLAALIHQLSNQKKLLITLLVFICLSIFYYLFKNMQKQKGILDESITYKEVFWRNFFRTKKANMFLIPPSSIINQINYNLDFESSYFNKEVLSQINHTGKNSILIVKENSFCRIFDCTYPILFNEKGNKKIRLSFWSYFTPAINKTHIFIQFFDKNHLLIKEYPFYLSESDIFYNMWDYKEFGIDLSEDVLNLKQSIHKIEFSIWNVEGKQNLYIDDFKAEFILTDNSYSILK